MVLYPSIPHVDLIKYGDTARRIWGRCAGESAIFVFIFWAETKITHIRAQNCTRVATETTPIASLHACAFRKAGRGDLFFLWCALHIQIRIVF